MEIVPVGIPVPFEYTAYDQVNNLNIGMAVYDVTSGAPVLVGAIVPMIHVVNGTYFANFTFAANKIYVVNKMVYTDNTFTVPLVTYSPGSESVQASTIESDVQAILNLVASQTGPAKLVGKIRSLSYLRGSVLTSTRVVGKVRIN